MLDCSHSEVEEINAYKIQESNFGFKKRSEEMVRPVLRICSRNTSEF